MDDQLRELERRMHDDEQSAMLFAQGLNRAEGSCEPYLTRKIGELERLVKTILIAEAKLAGFPTCTFERHGEQTTRPAFYVRTIDESTDYLDGSYLFFTPEGLFQHVIDYSTTNPTRLPSNTPEFECLCHQHYKEILAAIKLKQDMTAYNHDKGLYILD